MDNQLFIFISGHGDFREGTSEGFFIPKDGLLSDPFQDTYIPHTRLERIVDNIPCNHILLAIDACYSGTFDEDIALERSRPTGSMADMGNELFIQRSLKPRSRLYITSGGKERTTDGRNYSPFTEHMLKGLRSYGINDNVLTFTELQGFMEVATPKPRSGEFGTSEPGGNFLFIARTGNTPTFTPPVRNEPPITAPQLTSVKGQVFDSNGQVRGGAKIRVVGTNRTATSGSGGAFTIVVKPGEAIEITLDDHYPHVVDYSGSLVQYVQNQGLEVRMEGKKKVSDTKLPGAMANTVADPKSAIVYPIKQLNGQMWMMQNLNTPINNSYCYQNNDANCEKYGRLYEYEAAVRACESLGEGWHLPSGEEWRAMIKVYGGVDEDSDDYGQKAGQQLGQGGNSGFNATYGGMKRYSSDYSDLGQFGNYWTGSFDKNRNHKTIAFSSSKAVYYQTTSSAKKIAYSCRCVKN